MATTTTNSIDWHNADLKDLVTVTDMAKRAGLKLPAMSNMASRSKDFPKPLDAPGIAGRVYVWSEVKEWLANRQPRRTARQKDDREADLSRAQKLIEELTEIRDKYGISA